ncbi:MAG: photosystem II reaction center protein Psb28 [Leptolyngbyaceae cyanobacterium MO_188.B28]|nr:photosystem II reaction center protein Psb28 [Leptolyngbyaceae cyanobacterium MO_188.B28]
MHSQPPTIQFYEGISEELSNVSLRRDLTTGARRVVFMFKKMESIERFNTFRNRFAGALRLTDSEGQIEVEPSGIRFIFGGPEGDDLERVECTLEIDQNDHWERFMRFMHRYAEANGMAYGERGGQKS